MRRPLGGGAGPVTPWPRQPRLSLFLVPAECLAGLLRPFKLRLARSLVRIVASATATRWQCVVASLLALSVIDLAP